MAGRIHVLIVEDEPLIVEVLQGTLELDYRVSSANTVGQGLAFLRTAHVDVVLVDSVLPDGRGAEVARVAETFGAAVIEMSGYPQDIDDPQRAQRLYLCKPFGPSMLLSAIENALNNHSRAGTEAM
jgi:two-component system, OmpR family, catabolic regulation response regulator CreB